MKITPLQKLILDKSEPIPRVRQATGRSRTTIWRWSRGETAPTRSDAEKLIELYGPGRLDFDGCYVHSIEITEEQAKQYGLLELTAQ